MHLWVQLDKIRKAFLIKIKDVNTAYAEVELTITSYVIEELTPKHWLCLRSKFQLLLWYCNDTS